jgi:hypothetical protein
LLLSDRLFLHAFSKTVLHKFAVLSEALSGMGSFLQAASRQSPGKHALSLPFFIEKSSNEILVNFFDKKSSFSWLTVYKKKCTWRSKQCLQDRQM